MNKQVNNNNSLSKDLNSLLNSLNTVVSKKPKRKSKKNRKAKGLPILARAGGSYAAPVSQGYIRPEPRMTSALPSRKGSEFRVVGCDYIGSISAALTATDTIFELNPSSVATFPRLSAIQSVYGKYAFNKLQFYVVGKAASTLAGDMTSVVVYSETNGATALTESQIKNRVGQITSKFWENHKMVADCGKATLPWFVNDISDQTDNFGSFGNYHFFTEAVATATPVADLFIEYDIEFCEAKAIGDTDG